jgi:nucleotide-binding universal stress UspA family protein
MKKQIEIVERRLKMLPDIKKVLFATDLTQQAHHAYDYAMSVASRFGASITILYVMEEPSHSYSDQLKNFLGEERWQSVQENHEDHARQVLIGKRREATMIKEALGEFTKEAGKNLEEVKSVDAEVVVTSGNVVDEILSEAESREADLIVMGYHVRGKLGEAILGSTTRRLLRRSHIPVMMVRMEKEE